MKHTRSVLSILLILSMVITFAPLHTVQAAPNTPHIAWSPCYKELGNFECGTVQVPIDYSNPTLGAISIALIRIPASDPVQKIGSLFINPGGPGGSGVDMVLGAGSFLYTPEVRAKFDIVGFDPRGIARSTALRCFGTPKQWTPYFTSFSFPMTLEEASVWETADLYLDANCAQRGTKLMDYMSTGNVARDLDMLRQAVDDELLTYVGFSYGTFIGQVYANMFPDKVRALVIDGVLDPVAWSTGAPGTQDLPFSTRLRSSMGAQATLNEFFRLCDENPSTCPFAGATPSAERFAMMAESLKLSPLPIPQPDGSVYYLGYSNLIGSALSAMYNPYAWPSLADLLAALQSMLPAQVIMEKLQHFWVDSGLITKRGVPAYPNNVEGFPGVACGDSDNPDTYAAWWDAALLSEAQDGYFGRLWTYASSVCAAWPGKQNGRYTGPWNQWTRNPVLVVGNYFDPATRYQGAMTAASLLPNSRLVSLDGWGHCSIFLSTCMDQLVAHYLLTGEVPPAGTVCSPDQTPFVDFALSASSDQASQARLSLFQFQAPDLVKKGAAHR